MDEPPSLVTWDVCVGDDVGLGGAPVGRTSHDGHGVQYALTTRAEPLHGRSPIPVDGGEVQMVQKSSAMQKTGDGVSPPTVIKSPPPQPRLPKGSESVRGSVKPKEK